MNTKVEKNKSGFTINSCISSGIVLLMLLVGVFQVYEMHKRSKRLETKNQVRKELSKISAKESELRDHLQAIAQKLQPVHLYTNSTSDFELYLSPNIYYNNDLTGDDAILEDYVIKIDAFLKQNGSAGYTVKYVRDDVEIYVMNLDNNSKLHPDSNYYALKMWKEFDEDSTGYKKLPEISVLYLLLSESELKQGKANSLSDFYWKKKMKEINSENRFCFSPYNRRVSQEKFDSIVDYFKAMYLDGMDLNRIKKYSKEVSVSSSYF